MDLTFKTSGFKELEAVLKELPDNVAKKITEQAVRAGAKIVLDAAKSKVPVRTGRLRDSLMVKKNTRDFKKYGSIKYSVGANLVARRGKTAPHAHLVEFGTVKMAAQPFLEPAFLESKEAIITTWRGKLWVGIQQEAASLAGKRGSVKFR